MKHITLLISVVISVLTLLACQDDGGNEGNVKELGSQTNFLERCKTDDACDNGLLCVCGVCTERCHTDEDCRSDDLKGTCIIASEDQSAGSCVANARVESACMPECDNDDDCETDRVCEHGVCVPATGSPCLPTASCSSESATCAQNAPVGYFVFSNDEVFIEGKGPSCPGVCMVYELAGDISPNCRGDNCANPEEVEERIYCSCRCALPDGVTGEPCTCPDGMLCSSEMFEVAGADLSGGYCIKDGT